MTGDQILEALRSGEGYVSGQELCRQFGVSRTAIWKHIRLLREAGYEIEAVPNRGYRLLSGPDIVTAGEIAGYLRTEWMGKNIHYFETLGSTNQYAKGLAENGAPEGTLVVADQQTAGKGRAGRSWKTPEGSAIAMSLVLRPRLSQEKIAMTTLVMGLAAAKACRELCKVDAGIKWPNDVVVSGKKLCGILTEMVTDMQSVSYIVIGIGINTGIRAFPPELEERAVSLEQLPGEKVPRARLIAAVLQEFERAYAVFLRDQDLSSLMEEYNGLMVNRGRQVRVLDPEDPFTGVAEGISRQGELLVRDDGGRLRKVYAGEVSVRGIYGYV